MHRLSRRGHSHLACGVNPAVPEGLLGGTVVTSLAALLEQRVAVLSFGVAEGAAGHLVGLDDPQVAVEHRHVARHLLEERLVLALQPLGGRDVRGGDRDERDRAARLEDGRDLHEIVRGPPAPVAARLLQHPNLGVRERLLDRAARARSRAVSGRGEARPAARFAEDLRKSAVVIDDVKRTVDDRDPRRDLLEERRPARAVPRGGAAHIPGPPPTRPSRSRRSSPRDEASRWQLGHRLRVNWVTAFFCSCSR